MIPSINRVTTGSVYDRPTLSYPRLLVMRRWPRGVRKDAVDVWERDLGPGDELLDEFRAGGLDWLVFAARYRNEMKSHEELIDRVTRMAVDTGVTLLCGSHPDNRCHRTLLQDLIERRIG